jgi:hypothetical protein
VDRLAGRNCGLMRADQPAMYRRRSASRVFGGNAPAPRSSSIVIAPNVECSILPDTQAGSK